MAATSRVGGSHSLLRYATSRASTLVPIDSLAAVAIEYHLLAMLSPAPVFLGVHERPVSHVEYLQERLLEAILKVES